MEDLRKEDYIPVWEITIFHYWRIGNDIDRDVIKHYITDDYKKIQDDLYEYRDNSYEVDIYETLQYIE